MLYSELFIVNSIIIYLL